MTNEQLAIFIQTKRDELIRIKDSIQNSLPESLREEFFPIISLSPGPRYTYPILDDFNKFIHNLSDEVDILLGHSD